MLWESNPGPQTNVLYRRENEILYGGARGGGKSQAGIIWLILGNFDLDPSDPCYATYLNHKNYRALVLRVNATDLKDWVDEARKIYEPMGATFSGTPAIIQFPGGAKIYTNHLDSEDAFEKYKGWSLWKILVEEITLIPKQRSYLKLFGSLRAFNSDGKARTQVFATTNPDGPGSSWVCNRFVEVPTTEGRNAPWGRTIRDPITKKSRVFISAKVGDNPYAVKDESYMGELLSQDKATQDAWIHGLWHSMSGTFFREWRDQLLLGPRAGEPDWANHVIRPTNLRPYWYRWGGGDWGYDHPSALYKFCKNQVDGRVHVYDELVVRQVGSFDLGARLAEWWAPDLEALPDHQITLYFSPDAFDVDDARNTKAQQVQAGICAVFGPGSSMILNRTQDEKVMAVKDPEAAERMFGQRIAGQTGLCINLKRANHNRSDGAAFIRDLLRWHKAEKPAAPDMEYAKLLYERNGVVAYTDYLGRFKAVKQEILPKVQVWQRQGEGGQGCPRLIRCLPMLQRDPDAKKEDVLKFDYDMGHDGDDPYDAFRYGAMAYSNIEKTMPRSYFVMEQMQDWEKQYTDINILAQIRRTQESRYDSLHPTGGSFTFARAGSSRHKVN